jgi:arylsulfatase
MQYYALQFLATFKDYPPSQVPGDWSLSTIEEQIKEMIPTSE